MCSLLSTFQRLLLLLPQPSRTKLYNHTNPFLWANFHSEFSLWSPCRCDATHLFHICSLGSSKAKTRQEGFFLLVVPVFCVAKGYLTLFRLFCLCSFSKFQKKRKKCLDGVYQTSFRFCQIFSDFLEINSFKIPISLRKHYLKSCRFLEN